jgi:hypothetical protein
MQCGSHPVLSEVSERHHAVPPRSSPSSSVALADVTPSQCQWQHSTGHFYHAGLPEAQSRARPGPCPGTAVCWRGEASFTGRFFFKTAPQLSEAAARGPSLAGSDRDGSVTAASESGLCTTGVKAHSAENLPVKSHWHQLTQCS